MATTKPKPLLRIEYAEAAQAYLRSLPLEHFMESTSQSTQRQITVESLELLQANRPEVQVFSELLVQYPHGQQGRRRQVVPDNMVVVWKDPIKADGSYDLPFQPCGPFWVLEYVSKNNKRQDYDDNMRKYEKELKVPYYLLFVPDEQELTVYKHSGRKYRSLRPTEQSRYAIPKLDLEMGLLDGWVRYWYQGDLLPLPAELLKDRDGWRRKADEASRRAEEERRARLIAEQEISRLQAQLEHLQMGPGKDS